MAEVKAMLGGINGETLTVKDLLLMEWCCDADAPCDGLRVQFMSDAPLFEVYTVRLELDGETAFFGYCDTQKSTLAAGGQRVSLYARSSAALLVDSEAEPMTYHAPTAQVIFHREAAPFGFTGKLPVLCSEYDYTVPKGTSRYGALNRFVQTLCRKPVRVSAQNELFVPDGSGTVWLDAETVLQESRSINRGGAVMQVDYKIEGDTGFSRHCKSRFLEGQKVTARRKTDLSALPAWQRDYALSDMLYGAADDYCEATITVAGCRRFHLYDKAVYRGTRCGEMDGFVLVGFVMHKSAAGESTRLTFRKQTDLKEMHYVAE